MSTETIKLIRDGEPRTLCPPETIKLIRDGVYKTLCPHRP